jgi:hypothetical protein
LNISAFLNVDLPKPGVYLTIMMRTSGTREYDKLYRNSNVDICNVQKGIFGGFVIKMIAQSIGNYSNFRFECPQKKRFLYLYDFPVFDIKLVAMFASKIEEKSPEFEYTMVIKGKPIGKRSAEHVMTAKLYGQIFVR